jgi:hypothetical protein
MASAYDTLKQRLASSSRGFSGGGYTADMRNGMSAIPLVYTDTRTPIEQEAELEAKKARVDANLAGSRIAASDATTNARSAFAQGRASAQKRLFKRPTAFGQTGRLQKANLDAVAAAQKNALELESLVPNSRGMPQGAVSTLGQTIQY